VSAGELPDRLAPLAFLLGHWAGEGMGGFPDIADFRYRQEVEIRWPGGGALAYRSSSWAADDGRPLAGEAGYWRLAPDGTVELVLAHSTGIAEVHLGSVQGSRVDLATDVVARTATARDVRGERRLYGLVGGELMYAVDIAVGDRPFAPHLSARLQPGPAAG
jgi:hypothetical protein